MLSETHSTMEDDLTCWRDSGLLTVQYSVFDSEAITSFKELGQRTKSESENPRFHFLTQKAAMAIQWGNTAAVLGNLST